MHIHINTHRHTYTHTYARAHAHTHARTHTLTHAHARVHVHTCIHIVDIDAHIHACAGHVLARAYVEIKSWELTSCANHQRSADGYIATSSPSPSS